MLFFLKMAQLADLIQWLAGSRRIVITTHHKPDGDAMGSSLGLYNYLLKKGHQVHVVSPSDYPHFLHWLPGNAEVVTYTEELARAKQLVEEAELIFCLDFNALSRINELGELVAAAGAKKIMVDHHLDPQGFEDFAYWDATACATAELIYRLIVDLGDAAAIDRDIATCLYTGIMTDSGSFRFPNTTSDVHRIIAELIDAGANNSRIHELVYDNNQENRLRFLGYCLSSKLVVMPEYHTAYFYISKQELDKFQIQTGDTEGIVNYALSLNGIKLAAFIVDRGPVRKMSFRSKGEFPANEIARKYFEGGGHRNAAGGSSSLSLSETVDRFIQILPEFEEMLKQ